MMPYTRHSSRSGRASRGTCAALSQIKIAWLHTHKRDVFQKLLQ